MGEKRTLVCDKCLRACCFHGEFYCDEHVGAGLVRATEVQLRRLDREHPCYFVGRMGVCDNEIDPILTDARVDAELAKASAQ